MSSWFEEFLPEFFRPSWSASERCLEPLVTIESYENEIVVTMDLPFVESKEDISVRADEDTLEVRAKMKRAVRLERWGTVQREVEFKSFRKVVRLPERVEPEGAKARFKAGVLQVMLPKARRGFEVKVG